MATVRLQRRIHRPPRRRLRAAGNGPRTRGHALPAPRPWRHRALGLKRGDPEMPPPPPARRPAGSAEARRLPAHQHGTSQVAPPKFPREGLRDKSPSRKSPELQGARPAWPSARSRPERRRGPHGHMQLFVFRPAGRCLRAASGCGVVSLGRDTRRPPREGCRPRAPRARSPVLPSSPRLQAHLI